MPPAEDLPGRHAPPTRQLGVLLVSLGSTEGLRRADAELHDSLVRAGAQVSVARARAPAPMRTLMLTDLAWARAARAATLRGLADMPHLPDAIVYSSTTAALLWPRPGAIRFDAPSAGNRRGRHGFWQRPLERRRLAQAPLLLPWSEGALREVPPAALRGDRALVVPVPVESSASPTHDRQAGAQGHERDILAITYAANPSKKGLDRVLSAWQRIRDGLSEMGPQELLVAGATRQELTNARIERSLLAGVRVVGRLPHAEYRELVRRARVFVCAPRREDHGIAQLEALADGCLLVSTPSPGPYVALAIARSLDPRLVSEDLASALRAALLHPSAGYAERAAQALAPFSREAVDRVIADELLARLRRLGGASA
jgi:hypothetical protein